MFTLTPPYSAFKTWMIQYSKTKCQKGEVDIKNVLIPVKDKRKEGDMTLPVQYASM